MGFFGCDVVRESCFGMWTGYLAGNEIWHGWESGVFVIVVRLWKF